MKRFPAMKAGLWPVLFFLTSGLVYLYVFMEWVFFVTKPSFMSGMGLWLQLKIYLLSALGMSVLPLLVLLLLAALDRLVSRPALSGLLVAAGTLVPALVLSSLILLLVDNFTYTVFKYGVVSTERLPRAAYGLGFLLLCGYLHIRMRRYILARSRKKQPVRRGQAFLLSGLLSLSVLLSAVSILTGPRSAFSTADVTRREGLPDIILLGSDGLDATHLSAYAYERATTPNIDALLSKALVAENAFPNGGTTAGSVASVMTGRLPIETRLIYPPDLLQGADAYQHLPGLLKRLGYRTVDLSVPYFGDALTLNMQGGFDQANERSGADRPVVRVTRALGGGDSAYFADAMLQRVSDRLLHIFFLKPMTNPYQAVIQPARREDEQKRFDGMIAALEESEDPVFIHVHMLGTHGPRFEIREQVFSVGQTQDRDWMMDFYDDAILNFDQYVGELFDYLRNSGTLQNTLVIVYSDHGYRWTVHQRVPLLFWFPEGAHSGRIEANAQNIDVAPTLLDYLGLSIPSWMQGQSLLRGEPAAPAYIFSASVETSLIEVAREGFWEVNPAAKTPPFFQIGYVGLVACDRWYELYVQNPRMLYGTVKGHSDSCGSTAAPSPQEAKEILLDHLKQYGFDVSSFPASVESQPSE